MYKNVIKNRLSMLAVNGLLALMMVFGSFGAANAQEAGNRILLPLVQAGFSEAASEPSVQAAEWGCFAKPRPVLAKRSWHSFYVEGLQRLLNSHGASPKLDVDGYFGRKTDAAVRRFQDSKEIGVDGIVGPVTWYKLCGY